MDLNSTITALTPILIAAFGFYQYRMNKMTDLKIDKWKTQEIDKSAKKSESISKIYGALWQLLHELPADRVYIIQPHPLINNLFLSVSLEVVRNGIAPMKSYIQRLPMSDVAAFAAELSSRDFMLYRNVEEDVKDKKARAIISTNGGRSAAIKKLSDEDHDWVGSIFCEFTRECDIQPIVLRQALNNAAGKIQYILPEYMDTK